MVVVFSGRLLRLLLRSHTAIPCPPHAAHAAAATANGAGQAAATALLAEQALLALDTAPLGGSSAPRRAMGPVEPPLPWPGPFPSCTKQQQAALVSFVRKLKVEEGVNYDFATE